MTQLTVEANSRLYDVAAEGTIPIDRRLTAVIQARLVDEITKEPPQTDIALEWSRSGLTARTGAGGLVGAVGRPGAVFPNLATVDDAVTLTVRADGYVSRELRVTVPQQTGFPGSFFPVDLGDIELHREAVVLRGRVISSNSGARTPLDAMPVAIIGVWDTLPPAGTTTLPDTADLVSIAPTLYADRDTTATLRRRRIDATGYGKRLLRVARAADRTLRLSDRVGLAAGGLLEIEWSDPAIPDHDAAKTEVIAIDAVDGTASDAAPATVTLRFPLAFEHAEGLFARTFTLKPDTDTLNPLKRTAHAGDECVFLDGLADLSESDLVAVEGGADAEYHKISLFAVESDASGYFRFPPISRIAQVRIVADPTGTPTAEPLDVNPDYTSREHRIELVHS